MNFLASQVQVGKDQDQHTYEGVPLANVLQAAGVNWGPKCSEWHNNQGHLCGRQQA
jgi:hypothetical protein